jgi:hypothetical protein
MDKAARFHVAECVLLQDAVIEAELEEMAAAHPGGDIAELIGVGHTFLRTGIAVAERGETGDGDFRKTEVARVRRQLGQSNLAIEAGALTLLVGAVRYAVERDARFIEERRREDVGLADPQAMVQASAVWCRTTSPMLGTC